jgi:hypothetical protein
MLSTSSVTAGKKIRATESVKNVGTDTLHNVSAVIESEVNLVVLPSAVQNLGMLRARQMVTVNWTLCSPISGTYLVVAQANGVDPGGAQLATRSSPQRLDVTGRRRACLSRP